MSVLIIYLSRDISAKLAELKNILQNQIKRVKRWNIN